VESFPNSDLKSRLQTGERGVNEEKRRCASNVEGEQLSDHIEGGSVSEHSWEGLRGKRGEEK